MEHEVHCQACGGKRSGSQEYCSLCGELFQQDEDPAEVPAGSTRPTRRPVLLAATGAAVATALVLLALFVATRPRVASSAAVVATASTSQWTQAVRTTPVASASRNTPATSSPPRAAPRKTHTKQRSVTSLDPCDGQAYPFDYALSASASAAPNGSDANVAVSNVQQILAGLGYQGRSRTVPIAVDGWYGVHTEYAVKNFQRDHGIEPVGTVYQQTWLALADEC